MIQPSVTVSITLKEAQQRAERFGWEIKAAANGTYTIAQPGCRNLITYTSMTSIEDALVLREKALRQAKHQAHADQTRREQVEVRKAGWADAVRNASGEYLTAAPVDLDWACQPHPLPAVRICDITPNDAAAILARNEPRSLHAGRVTTYAQAMARGTWRLTHHSIATDQHSHLIDGHTRLAACVEAGVPFTTLVVVGIPTVHDDRRHTPPTETTHDVEPDVAGAIRLAIRYRNNNNYAPVSAAGIANYHQQHPDISDHVRRGRGLMASKRGDECGTINFKALAVAIGLLGEVCSQPDIINTYLYSVATGWANRASAGVPKRLLPFGDPRRRLRQGLHSGDRAAGYTKIPGHHQLGLIIIAWNHLARGEQPEFLTYHPDRDGCPTPQPVTPQLLETLWT